ncbi:hypothetical protein NBRC116589_17630 [Ruegeria sp. HU-ET01832]|uniref:hypothetical protein n=1 Tax=Ruegeria sp. HU-ET01832 TaxID=3135906 RepID=UPI003103E67F
MPIQINSCESAECDLNEWSLGDPVAPQLIDALAYLYLRQERNAQNVIDALEPKRRSPPGRVAENVIRKLTAPDPKYTKIIEDGSQEEKEKAEKMARKEVERRDGLLFQHLSWIAARLSIPNGTQTPPHVRSADKGFDGFIIEMSEENDALERIVLCEDKASIAPRTLITSSVWKEIKSIRAGERDDEILADLTTLVGRVAGEDQDRAEAIVDDALWEEVRQFRVSVATGENIRRHGSFEHVLTGFQDVAPGGIESRTGSILPFEDVRIGLSELAAAVINRVHDITKEAGEGHV